MKFSRRDFLKVGLGGAAVLTTAGVASRLVSFAYPDEIDDLDNLTAREARVIRALVETMTPHELYDTFPYGEAIRFVDELVGELPQADGRRFRGLLFLFENATIAFGMGLRPFTALDLNQRVDYLARWASDRRSLARAAYNGLKAIGAMAVYQSPAVFAVTGYSGPMVAASGAGELPHYAKLRAAAKADPVAVMPEPPR